MFEMKRLLRIARNDTHHLTYDGSLVPFLLNKFQFYSCVIPAKAGIHSIISGFRIKCGMTKSESFFLETALVHIALCVLYHAYFVCRVVDPQETIDM
jgi:hypothetical protein